MRSTLLLEGLVAACLVGGCASGWPHTHHLAAPKVTGNCTPVGSRIPRNGCETDGPATETSQGEYDRAGLGAAGTPLQNPGGLHQPRS